MYTWSRRYNGPIRAVILDWAGTAVDHGCQGPVGVFIDVFKRYGVTIMPSQAREPMGLHKREHIRAIAEMAQVRRAWILRNGAPPNEDDIAAMYALAMELQQSDLHQHATPIPGVPELVGHLQARGIRVGATSGYSREMLDVLESHSARLGFEPEVSMATTEVERGRPAPWMCWRVAEQLGVFPAAACIKVGDTPVDIEAGLNAGMWTVGVSCSGNLVGLTAPEWARTPAESRDRLRARAEHTLESAGAHYVIDAAPYLLEVVDKIEARLARGEQP